MKKLLSIISVLLLLAGTEASAEIIQGYVLLNGEPTPADYTLLSDGKIALGTGQNACISQYSEGRVIVPPQITLELKTIFGIVIERKTYMVTEVMPMAFRFCTKLQMVQFKEGITHIGNFAFKGCSKLEELVLPSTLESVGTGAFIGLENLNLVTCQALIPPKWEYNDVFFFHEKGISDTQVHTFRQGVFLHVPAESAEAYKTSVFSDPSLGWITPEGWGTVFSNINGSALENFHVCDKRDLEDVRRISNDVKKFGNIKNLWIEADIVVSDTIWPTPIGANPEEPFIATIYGQGHHIDSLHVENKDVAALIGYYAGKHISGVRMDAGYFEGKQMAAGLVASAGDCTIDSCSVDCYARGNGYVGTIAANISGKAVFDRCFSDGQLTTMTANATPYFGGVAGYIAKGGSITNCAVMSSFNAGHKSGHFIGGCDPGESVDVDYSYSLNPHLPNTREDLHVKYGEHIILYGQKSTALTYLGDKLDIEYRSSHMQCTYPASVLGTKGWVYAWDRYPMPDCFVDEWPVKPNYVIYGSEGAMQGRTNVLTPDEDIPAEAWRDLTDIGFRSYRFKANRLSIDSHLNVQSRAEELPLGISRRIVSTNGVDHNVVLRADYQGIQDMMMPVYEVDDDNNFVLDANGNLIQLGEMKVGEKEVWKPRGYALSLPYDVTFGANTTLYQPTRIYDVNGQTTALFEPVRDNRAEPFRAYYLVVHRDSVILGTSATVHCPLLEGAVSQIGEFEFSGSMSNTHYTARKRYTYTLKDGSWQRQSATDNDYAAIEPFSSFFHAVGVTTPEKIVMAFSDDNPVISVGDFYYTLVTQDDGTYTATLTGYHGRGGNAVVPATIATAIGGFEQQIPVTQLGADIFTLCTAQVWSIDLSQCTNLKPVTINRTAAGNPFYKVDERTIIYMPEGKAQPGKNNVIGTECQSLTITDAWDFRPPYDFHADEAIYDRIFYAVSKKDGTYESYAYTLCLPFSVSTRDIRAAAPDGNVDIHTMQYVNTQDGSFVFTNYPGITKNRIEAGLPYVIVVSEKQFQIKAYDTQVVAKPIKDEYGITLYREVDEWTTTYVGDWMGSFTRISNEEAAAMNAYTMNAGKWYRIRSDEGSYRGAYINTFRAYFAPLNPLSLTAYKTFYVSEPQADDDILVYKDFPADHFVIDSNFSNYDDETGIEEVQGPKPMVQGKEERWYSLDGRKLDSKPQSKGMYIVNGKKVIVK